MQSGRTMVAGGYGIPPPNSLQLDDVNVASNWRTWKTAWENYELATGVAAKEENIRVATLKAVIGEEANKVFETFVFTDNENKKKFKPILAKYDEYLEPRKNYIYTSFKFHSLSQGSDGINMYVCHLWRHLSQSWTYFWWKWQTEVPSLS